MDWSQFCARLELGCCSVGLISCGGEPPLAERQLINRGTQDRVWPLAQFGTEGPSGTGPRCPTCGGGGSAWRLTVAASQQGDSPEVFLASGDTDRLSRVSLRQNLQYPSIQDVMVRRCRLQDDLIVTVQRDAQIELTPSLLGQRRAQEDGVIKSDSCPELSDEGFSNAAERNQPFVKQRLQQT